MTKKRFGKALFVSIVVLILMTGVVFHYLRIRYDVLQSWTSCFQAVQPVSLDGMFSLTEPIAWNKTETVITYGSQPQMDTFLEEHYFSQLDNRQKFGKYRMYELGPIHAGEDIALTPLTNELVDMLLYDENHTFIPSDYRGIIPVRYESRNAFLLLYLKPEPENGEPIIHIVRGPSSNFAIHRQAVRINFSGLDTNSNPRSFPDRLIEPFYNSPGQRSIFQSFQKQFSAYDLILRTDNDNIPSDPYSTVYIGVADPPIQGPYVGEAELIDSQNRVPNDIAFVDAGNVRLLPLRLFGSKIYGNFLGLIAAHEMGHLLGLRHTLDPDDIMSASGCRGIGINLVRLLNKKFTRAPLAFYGDFTLGYQDAEPYLYEVLGSMNNTRHDKL